MFKSFRKMKQSFYKSTMIITTPESIAHQLGDNKAQDV